MKNAREIENVTKMEWDCKEYSVFLPATTNHTQ